MRAWFLVLTLGCDGKTSDDSSSEEADADTDSDSDSDSDADTDTDTDADADRVRFDTTMGSIVIELYGDAAPVTAANILQYVDDGFYDGTDGQGATVIHRVISGFMIQGGGITEAMSAKSTRGAIVNESDNGISNTRGTVAMARTNDPDSATSQWFVNLVDNAFLDIDGHYPPGYAVFGEVTSGMDVVDAIAGVSTGTISGYDDVPEKPIVITSASRE